MSIVTKTARIAALFALMFVPAVAHAQEESRISLSFTPAVATASGESELALAGTASYRFTDHFSFEGDVTWVGAPVGGFRGRDLSFDLPTRTTGAAITTIIQGIGNIGGRNRGNQGNFPTNIGGITVPILGPISASSDGYTWIGTMGVRYEPRVQTAKFRPYVSGGLGINHTDERFDLAATSITQAASYSRSHSGVAFSAGGGANVHIGGALWLAADAKYFRLSNDNDLMRLGGGVTFKF